MLNESVSAERGLLNSLLSPGQEQAKLEYIINYGFNKELPNFSDVVSDEDFTFNPVRCGSITLHLSIGQACLPHALPILSTQPLYNLTHVHVPLL